MNGTGTVVETPGEALGRLIAARWMKKSRLARALGTSAERLNRIIAGESQLTAAEAARLADIFGVEIETFVPARDGAE